MNPTDFFLFIEGEGSRGLLRLFWYFFIFELPRYVLTDYVALGIFWIKNLFQKKTYEQAKSLLWAEKPFVSIIVPGKDEGKHYYALVRSLKEQSYQNFEIIVVDDGSEDDSEVIGRNMEKQGYIDLFLRNDTRGGKASAANLALRYAKGKFILHFDADCSFNYDAIEELLVPFYMDKRIGAVGGSLEVRNSQESLATTLQTIEYYLTITVGRMATSSLGILRIISGAFGAFRREAIDTVKGWDVGPGLDGDLTVKIRKLGYKIHFTPRAIAQTDVPSSFLKLAIQRIRWSRSLVRFRTRKHKNVFFPSQNFRFSNFFSLLENIFYHFILNFVWFFYWTDMLINFTPYIFFILIVNYVLYSVSKFLQFGVVLAVTKKRIDKVYLLLYIPAMVIYTGYFIRFVRTFAYLNELFFKGSFEDPWNPRKTSAQAQKVESRINSYLQKYFS